MPHEYMRNGYPPTFKMRQTRRAAGWLHISRDSYTNRPRKPHIFFPTPCGTQISPHTCNRRSSCSRITRKRAALLRSTNASIFSPVSPPAAFVALSDPASVIPYFLVFRSVDPASVIPYFLVSRSVERGRAPRTLSPKLTARYSSLNGNPLSSSRPPLRLRTLAVPAAAGEERVPLFLGVVGTSLSSLPARGTGWSLLLVLLLRRRLVFGSSGAVDVLAGRSPPSPASLRLPPPDCALNREDASVPSLVAPDPITAAAAAPAHRARPVSARCSAITAVDPAESSPSFVARLGL